MSDTAWLGLADKAGDLVRQGADIHANDDEPLRWASEGGHTEVVRQLLDLGADIHAKGDLALQAACRNGHGKSAALLLDRGADMHAGGGQAFLDAARNGQEEILKLLLIRNGPGGKALPLEEALKLAEQGNHNECCLVLIATLETRLRKAGARAMRAAKEQIVEL